MRRCRADGVAVEGAPSRRTAVLAEIAGQFGEPGQVVGPAPYALRSRARVLRSVRDESGNRLGPSNQNRKSCHGQIRA